MRLQNKRMKIKEARTLLKRNNRKTRCRTCSLTHEREEIPRVSTQETPVSVTGMCPVKPSGRRSSSTSGEETNCDKPSS